MLHVFRLLARLKFLRGTRFDPFGYSRERKLERQLVEDYESTVKTLLAGLNHDNYETAVAIAALPQRIRGYGHIKENSANQARSEQAELFKNFNHPAPHESVA